MFLMLKAIDCDRITCNRIEYDDVKEIYEGAFRTFFYESPTGKPYADVLSVVLHENGRILEVGMEDGRNDHIGSGRGMDKEVCGLCLS